MQKTKLLVSLGLGLVATTLTSATPLSHDQLSAEALRQLDPSLQMLKLCGGSRTQGTLLRNQLQFAMATMHSTLPAESPPTLVQGLDNVHYRISTSSALAQRYFDQGLALIYGFNHAEAIRYFRHAQRLDPKCAMCWWGEAFAHGPNINAPMDPEVNARAIEASSKALSLKSGVSPAEQALIEAVATRYSANPAADRAVLDKAFAERMLSVASGFPDDDTIAVLAAEAVMDTQPWDYWEADRQTPKGRMTEAIALVERVLARNPDHPQADHLYIHLVEASANPGRAEQYADRLAKPLVPAAGHLVHMPGHLYYRLGRFKDAIRVNVEAARVDEDYLRSSKEAGLYRFGYYPHNVHFIVTSAQMAGDMRTAITEARKLSAILNTDLTAKMPWVQPVDAAPYFAYAQFASPAEILALKAPDARLPYVTAIWRYARAIAFARKKDRKGVAREVAAIRKIRETTDFKPMVDQLVPAPDLLRLAEIVAQARLAYARSRYTEAVDLYREAAKVEDGIRYMEPPFWYYPVRQSLGAALYRSGDYNRARQAFLEALAQAPNNGWALYGLMETQRATGDRTGVAASQAALQNAWLGDQRWLTMDRL
jgi:tetratricopeptide (TPR) repeat protein